MFASKKANSAAHSSTSVDKGKNSLFFQPRLNVGKPGDKYEVEADRTADQILARDNDNLNQPTFFAPSTILSKKPIEETLEDKEPGKIQEKPLAEAITPLIQKEEKEEEIQTELTDEQDQVQKQAEKDIQQAEIVESQVQKKTVPTVASIEIQSKEEEIQEKKEDEEEETIQEKSFVENIGEAIPEKDEEPQTVQTKTDENPNVSSSLESKLNSSKGSGSPLPEDTRSEMESGFGTDFGNVRVHTDSAAVQMSKGLGAQAFTHGSDIYFNEGKYNPANNSGKHLLAHELTHTVQQGASVQTKMVQKEEGDEELTTPTNEFTYTDPANREEYSINTVSNTASIPTVGVPRFKVP
ncbi:MAG: DUF4157 domain-containing protein, partial [Draconibacterium sp.]|nr:DUF4157 domain-containing protein [Draconibacterium sp.]